MKCKSKFKLVLTYQEKQSMRKNKIRLCDLPNYALDELEVLLDTTSVRAREIGALMDFQSIKTIGIKFAEDLISLGYYSINELKEKDPAKLTEEFEILKGYWIDPCVEDQFRLVVYHANTNDNTKNWWDFTEERKKFRIENGYPTSRPKKPWYEMKSAILTYVFCFISIVTFSENREIVVNIDGFKLDTNFLGMPMEGVGVSNNAKSMMGPPKYEDSKFQLNNEELVVNIRIKYL